jgi:DNA repair protein RecO (recombination protein O)
MPAEKSLALILRLVEFSETSVVVTLFTRDFGKITAVAKGARRPQSPFEAALDLLALVRVLFLHKSSGAMDLLTEARLERRFRAASRDLARLHAGYYVAELLRELTDDADPHPELFDEADRTLADLDGDAPVAMALVRFELAALRLLGHLPALHECVGCGTPLEAAGRVAFGQIAGGVLCPKCRAGQRSVVSVSSQAIAALRRVAEGEVQGPKSKVENMESEGRGLARRPEQEENVGGPRCEVDDRNSEVAERHAEELDRKVLGEIRGLLNNYLAHLVGHKLRMHPYISRVS